MVILDASVVFKWFEVEDNSDKALTFLAPHQNQKNIILVPDLLFYELTNAWTTKTLVPVKNIKIFLKKLEDINLKMETVNFKLLGAASIISKKYKTSLYDATYIALAKQKKCLLITADERLVEKVKLPFVKSL